MVVEATLLPDALNNFFVRVLPHQDLDRVSRAEPAEGECNERDNQQNDW